MIPATADFVLRLGSGTLLFFITAAIILYVPNEFFLVFLILILAVIGGEWLKLIHTRGIGLYLFILVLSIIVAAYWLLQTSLSKLLLLILSLWYIYAMTKTLFYVIGKPFKTSNSEKTIEAFLFLSLFYLYSVYIYQHSNLLALLCFTMICFIDIGGYVGGKLVGGIKLCPRLSPQKTYAGLAGGVIFCYLAYMIMQLFFPQLFISTQFMLLLLPFSLITQAGDLYQSMLKRQAQKKDSGHWIPGHGGLFDRADTFLFGVPAFYYLMVLCELVSWDLQVP